MTTALRTQRPKKGDLVPGHRVAAFLPGDLPYVPGQIIAVSASGHSVTMETKSLFTLLGLPHRSTWTWRERVGAYQQKGCRTSPGWGLALVRAR